MRPQRPASAAVGVSRPSPFAARRTRPSSSSSPAISSEAGGDRSAFAPRQPAAALSGRDEVVVLQDQLRALVQRQSEVDGQHQRAVTAFRHRLRRLHNDNAVMRSIISAAESRKRNGDRLAARAPGGAADMAASSVTEAECQHLQTRINLATRKLNQLQHEMTEMERQVRRHHADEAAASAQLHQSAERALVAGGSASVFLRTQKMEQRLDAILMQQSGVGVVLRGYEHHLQELAEESRRYEGCLLHLDAEYTARHRDHIQLIHLYQNAQEEYKRVCEEREGLLRTLHRLRAAKEQALADKTGEVTAALRETQRREQNLADLQQQLEEEAQQLEYAEHVQEQLHQRRHLSRAINDVVRDPAATADGTYLHIAGGTLTAEEGERLAAYEQAFRAMMQAARVHRLEDLVTAYENEHVSHDQLAAQVADARAAYDALTAEVKRLRRRQEEAGGVGGGGGALSTSALAAPPVAASSGKLLAELQAFVREEQAELQRRIEANEAGEALLLELARRVDRIVEKTAAYRPDVSIPPTAEQTLLQAQQPPPHTRQDALAAGNSARARVRQGRSVLMGHLAVLKQKLFALADDATAAAAAAPSSAGDLAAYTFGGEGAAPAAVVRSTQVVIPENNVRVPLERRAVAASMGQPAGYTRLQQQRASWVREATADSAATAPGRSGQRPSIFTDDGDGDDDSVDLLLLRDDPAPGGAEQEEEAGGEAVATASSSFTGGAVHTGKETAVTSTAPSAAADKTSRTRKQKQQRKGSGGDSSADGSASQWKSLNDDPLDRAEVKKMSEAIQLRERRRREREERLQIDGAS